MDLPAGTRHTPATVITQRCTILSLRSCCCARRSLSALSTTSSIILPVQAELGNPTPRPKYTPPLSPSPPQRARNFKNATGPTTNNPMNLPINQTNQSISDNDGGRKEPFDLQPPNQSRLQTFFTVKHSKPSNNEQTSERTNQPTNEPTNQRTNERTNEPTNEPTNDERRTTNDFSNFECFDRCSFLPSFLHSHFTAAHSLTAHCRRRRHF